MSSKCKVCECLFFLSTRSEINPDRCTNCENYEEKMSEFCPCGNIIELNLTRYRTRGNICNVCMEELNYHLRNKTFSKKSIVF